MKKPPKRLAAKSKPRIFRRVGPTGRGIINGSPTPNVKKKDRDGGENGDASPGQNIAELARKTLLNELAPAAVAVDEHQRIVYYHGNTERYLAQPKSEATRKIMQLVRKPLRSAVQNALRRVQSQKKPCTVRERAPSGPKSKLHVEVIVTPLPRASRPLHYLVSFVEHPVGAVVIADGKQGTVDHRRLVRELQQARDELQASNEEFETSKEELQALNDELSTVNAQLRGKMDELENSTNEMATLLSSTEIAVVFVDRELRIRKFTPAIKDLFEVIDSDVGRPLSDLTPKFTDPALRKDIGSVLENGQASETEVTGNSGRTYMRRVRPYRKEDSRVEGVAVTFVDISARKAAELEVRRSESTHRLILKGIKEYGIFVLSLQGRFVTWTAGAERILGYSEREAIGRHLGMIHTEEDKKAGTAESELALAAAGNDVFIERWHVRKDGSTFWGTGILSILNDEAGRPYGFVKVVRDNTDRKLAEDALHQAMKNAEAANASKDHFLANVSHELRTPLSATLLWAKLLIEQEEVDPKMLREGLNAIARSTKEQQVLIEDLMDTAKIVAGKLRLEPRLFDLNELFQTILPPIRSIAAEKNLMIEETLDGGVGTVEADPRRIQQVIANLLNNAIKFTPVGGRISVRTERNGDNVEIRVADSGIGIKKEFLSRIFDRFVQVDQGSTPTSSGMGLGLAIVKQLVEMHGGSVVAESAGKDRGSLFTIRLPLPKGQDLTEEPWTPQSSAISLRGWRILLVEDSPGTRHALEMILREAEGDVIAVATAQAALEEFDRIPADFILSDTGLAGMSGHELITEIRRRERERNLPTAPAIALTAYADEKNIRKAFESGFQDYTTKPIEPVALIAKLANLGARR